jgi:AdoMet-dependent heme synthase
VNGHGRTAIRKVHQDTDQRPFLVIWESTRACQLVCQHCRADSQSEPHPLQLTTAEGKRLLDDIASFGAPSPMVVISGGDPFERSDLTELIAYGKQQGLSMALAPSVTPKATRARFAAAAAAGAKAVSISLDGASAATHDGFRGIEGVYDATVPVCRDIVELGMRLQINTTVTAGNVDELPDLLRQVIDLDAFLWSVFLLVPTGRGEALQALPPEEVEDLLHWLVDVSRHLAVKTTEAPHFRRVILQRRRVGEVDVAEHFGLGATYRRLAGRAGCAARGARPADAGAASPAGHQRGPRVRLHRPHRQRAPQRLPPGAGRVAAGAVAPRDLPGGTAVPRAAGRRSAPGTLRALRVPQRLRGVALPGLRGHRRSPRRGAVLHLPAHGRTRP